MYRKKFLPKLLIASILVGGVNFFPINFSAENLQIVSVAYAKVEKVTAKDSATCDFGDDNPQFVKTCQDVAKERAIQKAKEAAGLYVKTSTKVVNSVATEDEIFAYTADKINILNVTYKKIPVQQYDIRGNDMGKIAFAYEATVTAEIDTSGFSAYIKQSSEKKSERIANSKELKKSSDEISNDFENLRKRANKLDKSQIKSEVKKIENKLLARQKCDEGNLLFKQRNYQVAIEKYNEAIKLNPDYSYAYYMRGFCHYDLKNYEQATSDCIQAIKLNPNNGAAKYILGFICFDYNNKMKMTSKSIEICEKVLEISPEDDNWWHQLGLCYSRIRNYDESIKFYTKAIELNPDKINHWNGLANAYNSIKNYEKAVECYTKVIELKPDNSSTYFWRGTAYYEVKKYEEAIKDFTKAIELKSDKSSYYMRGRAYENLKKYEEAIKDYTKVIELKPDDYVYRNRSNCYRELGDNEKANADLAKYNELRGKK